MGGNPFIKLLNGSIGNPPDRTGKCSYVEQYEAGISFLWVADMDFRSPPSVLEEARKASEHGNFGYGRPPRQLIEES